MKGETMKKASKEKAVVTVKERAARAVKGALVTSKAYDTTIGFLYHTRMFLLWLLNYSNEAELKKATVKTETGLCIKPGKGSILPETFVVTCASNTTGRAETVKIFDATGEKLLRFCFASPKFRYQGWNAGEKQCIAMAETLGLPNSACMQVQQGNKAYYWNDDFSLLQAYCLKRFGKGENK
jgi:hypothetical protein